MSRFYTSLHVKTTSREQLMQPLGRALADSGPREADVEVITVREARQVMNKASRRARVFLAPSINSWVSLFLECFTEVDALAEELSASLRTWSVSMWTDPDRAWGYTVFHSGTKNDQFVNDLAYYDGTLETHDEETMQGNPRAYRELVEDPNDPNDIVNLLQLARQAVSDEEHASDERISERVSNEFEMFRKALGIPHASSDYEYILQGDDSNLLRLDDFIHVTI